jgi:hypothetical protein
MLEVHWAEVRGEGPVQTFGLVWQRDCEGSADGKVVGLRTVCFLQLDTLARLARGIPSKGPPDALGARRGRRTHCLCKNDLSVDNVQLVDRVYRCS